MFDNVSDLRGALADSAAGLRQHALEAARSQTNIGKVSQDRSMAALAQAAIFSEALLAAIHARLQEIKAVTK
ncbi:MAG: hypothetical protein NVS1B14_11280 [Vulcanimicrobiaceae bacterium]